MSSEADLTYTRITKLFKPYDTRIHPERFQLNVKSLPPDRALKPASVLIPMFYKEGDLHVLLTLRSKDTPSYAGNVSFPGGMQQPSDSDATATALREAYEEIGIVESQIKIIAVLPQTAVRPMSLVTPVLALIPSDFQPCTDKREVDIVFDLPLKRFLNQSDMTVKTKSFYNGAQTYCSMHFQDVLDDVSIDTWGFTAHLCVQVAMVVYQHNLVFTEDNKNFISLDNCFSNIVTQDIIDFLIAKSKL